MSRVIAPMVLALRVGGRDYAGSSMLTGALQASWRVERAGHELLKDYVWAGAQCCGAVPSEVLDPIFDAWAAMPGETDDGRKDSRAALGADHLRWAFQDRVPRRAIGYFLQRADGPDLGWPILLMLNGIDDPDAIEFVAKELARWDEETEGKGGLWPRGRRAAVERGFVGTPPAFSTRPRRGDASVCTNRRPKRWRPRRAW